MTCSSHLCCWLGEASGECISAALVFVEMMFSIHYQSQYDWALDFICIGFIMGCWYTNGDWVDNALSYLMFWHASLLRFVTLWAQLEDLMYFNCELCCAREIEWWLRSRRGRDHLFFLPWGNVEKSLFWDLGMARTFIHKYR